MVEKPAEQIVGESYADFVRSLMELKVAVNEFRIQMKHTNKAMEKVLSHSHLNAMLTLTHQNEYRIKANTI